METQTAIQDPERTLVERFSVLAAQKKTIEQQLEDTKKQLDEVESELMQLLDDQGKKSSAKYDGIGYVTSVDPTPYASIVAGEEEVLFESLRQIGREDLIKLSVHTASLTTIVRDCLKTGAEIPKGCTFYLKRRLKFTSI